MVAKSFCPRPHAAQTERERDGTGFTFLINSETKFIIAELWLLDGFFFLGDIRKKRHSYHSSTEQLNRDKWISPNLTLPALCPLSNCNPSPLLLMPSSTIPSWGGVACCPHFDFHMEDVNLCFPSCTISWYNYLSCSTVSQRRLPHLKGQTVLLMD